MTKATEQQVVCVVGMHRSGTSCLTGSLQAGGLDLGKHSTWNRFNEKGNRENQAFVDFHENLLAENKASWDKPPKAIQYRDEHRLQAKAIVEHFSDSPRWGFKDPRATLALPLWRELIPNLQLIGIFRHPLAVVASLQHRAPGGEVTTKQALSLWHHYNSIVLREHQKQAFPLLCFDWDEGHFHQTLNSIHAQLGLIPLQPEDQFFAPDLQNFSASGTWRLPWRVRRLYKKLLSLVD